MASGSRQPSREVRQMSAWEREHGELPTPTSAPAGRKTGGRVCLSRSTDDLEFQPSVAAKSSSQFGPMASKTDSIGFKVWGPDNVVHGPVELPELVTWVQGKRITADTWIFSEKDDKWSKAAQLSELG